MTMDLVAVTFWRFKDLLVFKETVRKFTTHMSCPREKQRRNTMVRLPVFYP